MIPPDEHDVHELLHVMLSSLEEEMVKPKKVGCLSDALGQQLHVDIPQARPSSAMLSDFDNPEYNEMANLMRHTRSEAHTPDSPHSTCTDIDDSADTSLLDEQLVSDIPSFSPFQAFSAETPRETPQDRDSLILASFAAQPIGKQFGFRAFSISWLIIFRIIGLKSLFIEKIQGRMVQSR